MTETTMRPKAYVTDLCAGWVVDADRGLDRPCQRGGTIEGGGKRFFCKRHDPALLPGQISRLVRNGRPGEARRLAVRRGVELETMLLVAARQTPIVVEQLTHAQFLTRPQLEALERAAVRASEVSDREGRLLAGAVAVVRQVAARPRELVA
jgi:hypothetical protein